MLGRVDHAGAVDQRDRLEQRAVANLDAKVLEEVAAEEPESCEFRRKARDRGGAADVLLRLAVDEHGEPVVRRRKAHVLHRLAPDEPVDERGLAGGVVAEEEHARGAVLGHRCARKAVVVGLRDLAEARVGLSGKLFKSRRVDHGVSFQHKRHYSIFTDGKEVIARSAQGRTP